MDNYTNTTLESIRVDKNVDPKRISDFSNDYNNELSPYMKLIAQVREEYEIAYKAQNSRIQLLLKRLKIYNNQRRDPDTVGDNLLFTIFQSVFTSLYNDKMSVEFVGRTAGKQDVAEALNQIAKFDYDEMRKPLVDHTWDWDTLFFGTGLMGMTQFDREKMIPVPDPWDPTVTLHDPDAVSINGDLNGYGGARFFGREIMLRKIDMEDIPSVFGLDHLKTSRPTRSMIEQARQSREDAQGLNNQIRYDEKELGVNARFPLIEWYTCWKHPDLTNGKTERVMCWIGNDLQKVVRFKIVKKPYWPVVMRKLFPNAHQWDSVSIPDLVEDKQRLRAVLLNLGVKMMKSDLFGMYIFDKNKVKNKGDLNFDLDKMIPIDLKPNESLQNTVMQMPKAQPNIVLFNYIMQSLDVSAQRATSTPEQQMGQISKNRKTATEVNKADVKTGDRYSLTAKIWEWSEREFWEQWYGEYKDNFKPRVDEKMARISGAFGYHYKYFEHKDFITEQDPDVFITSKFDSDQKRANDRALMLQYGALLPNVPGANLKYFVKRTGTLHDIPEDVLNRVIPLSPDELKAKFENYALEDNDTVPIDPKDNDEEHLEEHSKARETPSTLAHIAAHYHQAELKKTQPQLYPDQQQGQPGQDQGKSQMDAQNPNQQMGGDIQKIAKKKVNTPQMSTGQFGTRPVMGKG